MPAMVVARTVNSNYRGTLLPKGIPAVVGVLASSAPVIPPILSASQESLQKIPQGNTFIKEKVRSVAVSKKKKSILHQLKKRISRLFAQVAQKVKKHPVLSSLPIGVLALYLLKNNLGLVYNKEKDTASEAKASEKMSDHRPASETEQSTPQPQEEESLTPGQSDSFEAEKEEDTQGSNSSDEVTPVSKAQLHNQSEEKDNEYDPLNESSVTISDDGDVQGAGDEEDIAVSPLIKKKDSFTQEHEGSVISPASQKEFSQVPKAASASTQGSEKEHKARGHMFSFSFQNPTRSSTSIVKSSSSREPASDILLKNSSFYRSPVSALKKRAGEKKDNVGKVASSPQSESKQAAEHEGFSEQAPLSSASSFQEESEGILSKGMRAVLSPLFPTPSDEDIAYYKNQEEKRAEKERAGELNHHRMEESDPLEVRDTNIDTQNDVVLSNSVISDEYDTHDAYSASVLERGRNSVVINPLDDEGESVLDQEVQPSLLSKVTDGFVNSIGSLIWSNDPDYDYYEDKEPNEEQKHTMSENEWKNKERNISMPFAEEVDERKGEDVSDQESKAFSSSAKMNEDVRREEEIGDEALLANINTLFTEATAEAEGFEKEQEEGYSRNAVKERISAPATLNNVLHEEEDSMVAPDNEAHEDFSHLTPLQKLELTSQRLDALYHEHEKRREMVKAEIEELTKRESAAAWLTGWFSPSAWSRASQKTTLLDQKRNELEHIEKELQAHLFHKEMNESFLDVEKARLAKKGNVGKVEEHFFSIPQSKMRKKDIFESLRSEAKMTDSALDDAEGTALRKARDLVHRMINANKRVLHKNSKKLEELEKDKRAYEEIISLMKERDQDISVIENAHEELAKIETEIAKYKEIENHIEYRIHLGEDRYKRLEREM